MTRLKQCRWGLRLEAGSNFSPWKSEMKSESPGFLDSPSLTKGDTGTLKDFQSELDLKVESNLIMMIGLL